MRLILFAIVIGILLFMTFMGYHKGLLRTVVSMSALIISLVIVYFFSATVTNFLDTKTSFRENVTEKVYEQIEEKVNEIGTLSEKEQKKVIEESIIPSPIVEAFDKTTDPKIMADRFAIGYGYGISEFIGLIAVKACGLILTFVIAFIVTKLVVVLSKIVSKVPIVGGINRILGAFLGFARGLVVVWLVLFAVTMLAGNVVGTKALEAISTSEVLSLFYNGALSFGKIFF